MRAWCVRACVLRLTRQGYGGAHDGKIRLASDGPRSGERSREFRTLGNFNVQAPSGHRRWWIWRCTVPERSWDDFRLPDDPGQIFQLYEQTDDSSDSLRVRTSQGINHSLQAEFWRGKGREGSRTRREKMARVCSVRFRVPVQRRSRSLAGR